MRASTTRRLTAFAAAALLAATVPGTAAASAQPSSPGPPPEQETGSGPAPPPLPPNSTPPPDNGQPDWPYTRTDKGCVASLPSNVRLQTIPWGQTLFRFDELHQFATGRGQTIAVIDTGVNKHAFFRNRLSGGGDYIAKGGTGLEDCDGHGTQVAGVIAADPPEDGIGFKGIAYDAKIVSIRQSSEFYEYKPPENSDDVPLETAGNLRTLAKGVVNAANKGVDVVNMSVDTCRSADSPISDMERELQRAVRYAVEVKDVVLVASAGNVPSQPCPEQNTADPDHPKYIVSPPWFSKYVLSVAAIDRSGAAAKFSMHGPWVSVAAPGTEIVSLDPGDPNRLVNVTVGEQGQPSQIQGTSFAAPYVAGLAALVRQRFAELGRPLSAKQVMDRIEATASHPAAPGGHNDQIGYGVVDPIAALTTMVPAEDGIPPDEAKDLPFQMPPPYQRDWTPMQVAMIGSGGGLALLLLTLFIVHTVRRRRPDRHDPA